MFTTPKTYYCSITVLQQEALLLQLGVELPSDTQYRVEFKDPEEQADDGQFPMTGQNTEFYFPFIGPIEIPIPLGIVTLWISKIIIIHQFSIALFPTE